MKSFLDTSVILDHPEVITADGLILDGVKYDFLRQNHGVIRGEFDNLFCRTFRNKTERHNISIYYTEEDCAIQYVETGYSLK